MCQLHLLEEMLKRAATLYASYSMSEGDNKGDFPNLDRRQCGEQCWRHPAASDMRECPSRMQTPGTEPELPELALFARNRSRAGTDGTFCSEPEPKPTIANRMISYAVGYGRCGPAFSWVTTWAKIAAMECDATTRRSAVTPATATNRAPSCNKKLAQRSHSVDIT